MWGLALSHEATVQPDLHSTGAASFAVDNNWLHGLQPAAWELVLIGAAAGASEYQLHSTLMFGWGSAEDDGLRPALLIGKAAECAA